MARSGSSREDTGRIVVIDARSRERWHLTSVDFGPVTGYSPSSVLERSNRILVHVPAPLKLISAMPMGETSVVEIPVDDAGAIEPTLPIRMCVTHPPSKGFAQRGSQ